MGTPSLLVALDYLELHAEVKPDKLKPARAAGTADSRSRRRR